jgi:hypothetical protein
VRLSSHGRGCSANSLYDEGDEILRKTSFSSAEHWIEELRLTNAQKMIASVIVERVIKQ